MFKDKLEIYGYEEDELKLLDENIKKNIRKKTKDLYKKDKMKQLYKNSKTK